MKQTTIYLSLVAGLFFAACSGNSSSQQGNKPIVSEKMEASEQTSAGSQAAHPGKAVYDKYCLVCHQADGSGVPGMYPPLTPNEWIADKDKMIYVALNGQSGEIDVNGETYNNLMPPHDYLSDQELADVISYVRSNFGNDLEAVTKEEVAAARK